MSLLKPPVEVSQGGTGATTASGARTNLGITNVATQSLTQFDVLVGGAANAITSIGPGTAGQVLQSGGAAANPVYSTATYPATAGTSGKILISNGTNIVSSTPTYPNSATGTGKLLRADGTNWLATTATYPDTSGTSGNVLTSDGTNWVSSTPAGGGFTWSVVTVDATIASNTGVIANKAGVLTMTLPATPTAGAIIEITGINNATGWKIAQNANQQIFFGTVSTTLGVGGSLQSTNTRDAAKLVCVVGGASAIWNVISCIGDITYV